MTAMSTPRNHPGDAGVHGPAAVLQVIRCWAAAVVVQQGLAWFFSVALFAPLASEERLESFGWRLLLLHVPGLLAVFGGVLAAGRLHPSPGRLSWPRHLTATLTAPLVSLAFSLGTTWSMLAAEAIGMALATLAFGSATALALDHAMSGDGPDTGNLVGRGVPARHAYGRGWDRGATATEYLGVIVVVASLVIAVGGTSLGGNIGDALMCQIQKVTGGGGCSGSSEQSAPLTDADYEPTTCNVSTITDTAGAKAKIAWFEWGNEYGFQEQTIQVNEDVNGDGTIDENDQKVALTFTDAASVGATKSGKPGLQIGKLGTEEVELGAGIKVTNGDTWIFDSPEEAEEFRDDIEEMKTWEMSTKYSGHPNIYGAYKWAEKQEEIEEKLGDKHISYGKIGIDTFAKGGLKISSGSAESLSATLKGEVKFAPEATITDNNVDGTKSYTYSATLEYGGEAGYEAGPVGGGHGGKQSRTGAVTVTYDKETGELVQIDMTQTVKSGEETDAVRGENQNGDKVSGSGSDGDSSSIDVTTNSISFEPGPAGDADRAIAQEWLDGSGNNTAPFAYMFGDHSLQKRPGGDDPFGQLLFDKGTSSKLTYDGTTDAATYGFELNLGMSVGMSVSMAHNEEQISDAQFLGAPDGDTRSFLPYSYCAQ